MVRLTALNKNLTMPILAALTPKDHNILFQEGTYDDIDFDVDCDVVGITYTTLDALCAYKIADEFLSRNIPVLLGGYHASALPDEAKQHADSVVIGEADCIWPQILKDIENDTLKSFYRQEKPIDPKMIPIPIFSLYSKNAALGIEAARGCPVGCEFCAISNACFGNIFRARPVENVLEELRLKPQKSISFYDPSLTTNPEYAKSLFRGIRDLGLNKHFACYGNVHVLVRDEELLKLASDAGVVQWEIGFESMSQKSLDGIGKKTNKVDEYALGIKKIHDYNMMVLGDFVFGFDGDTQDIGDRTLNFVNSTDMDIPDAQILTPFPGTRLFRRLELEGRIISKDWSKYDFEHVVFEPKNMSPEELFSVSKDFFKKSYTKRNITKRTIRGINLGYAAFTTVALENLAMATKRFN